MRCLYPPPKVRQTGRIPLPHGQRRSRIHVRHRLMCMSASSWKEYNNLAKLVTICNLNKKIDTDSEDIF